MKANSFTVRCISALALFVAASACKEDAGGNSQNSPRITAELVLECKGRTQTRTMIAGDLAESYDLDTIDVSYQFDLVSDKVNKWNAQEATFSPFCTAKETEEEVVSCEVEINEDNFSLSRQQYLKNDKDSDVMVIVSVEDVSIDRHSGKFARHVRTDVTLLESGDFVKSRSTSIGSCDLGRPAARKRQF